MIRTPPPAPGITGCNTTFPPRRSLYRRVLARTRRDAAERTISAASDTAVPVLRKATDRIAIFSNSMPWTRLPWAWRPAPRGPSWIERSRITCWPRPSTWAGTRGSRARMRIIDVLKSGKRTISFEFFPPKDDIGFWDLYKTIEALKPLCPSYVSVTYGAGGSTRRKTVELVKRIKSDIGIESMAHLTCGGATREEIQAVLDDLHSAGMENV